ncbi:rhamnosyltransferase [Spirochaetia bacterium]|nr:rhamnosyltransferase [Spirochaetia bacterium]
MSLYNICAIVTVYFPKEINVIYISELSKQVSSIIITDNTPNRDSAALFKNIDKSIYIPNKSNLGLSCSFNKCLKIEEVRLSDYILFMDQDSLIPDNLIKILIDDYNWLKKNGYNVGCIGPIYYEKNAKKIMISRFKKKLKKNIYSVKTVITSSMLTSYKNLEKIGFWNENIFLDLADWDLCWRFIKSKFICCMTGNAILTHSLGKSVKKIGLIHVKEGTAIREYYQTRDCLKLLFKPYTPLKFRVCFILMITIRPIIHVLFLSEKHLRLKYIILGICDFFKKKDGTFQGECSYKGGFE